MRSEYISGLFKAFESKKDTPKHESAPKRKSLRTPKQCEGEHEPEAKDIENLKKIDSALSSIIFDYRAKVVEPARSLTKAHADRVAKFQNLIEDLEDYHSQVKTLLQDPFIEAGASEDMEIPDTGNGTDVGADIPSMPADTTAPQEIPQNTELEAPQEEQTPEDAAVSDLFAPNETDAPDAPKIIDGWEFLASDPAYEGNSTLLYDNGNYTVFIQKDLEQNEKPYLCMTQNAAGQEQEYECEDMNSVCAWLESVEMPTPSEDAKAALVGYSHESKEEDKKSQEPPKPLDVCDCDKKLSKEFKLSKDSPEIARKAPEVEKPVVSNVDKDQK